MAYIDKIKVNGVEYDLGALESLKDTNGNNRFIEGINSNDTLTGLTINFSKWSLSGTHLMIVVAGELAAGATIADSYVLGECVNIPNWVLSKIYPTAIIGIVEFKEIRFNSQSSWANATGEVRLRKYNGKLFIDKNNSYTNDKGETLGFRVQFDLLIDTD